MKKMFLILLVLFVQSAGAENVWNSQTKIVQVYPQATGSVSFSFLDDSNDCTSTNSPKRYWLKVGENGVSVDGFKNMFSTALAAAMANKTVTVVFDKSSNECFINRILVEI